MGMIGLRELEEAAGSKVVLFGEIAASSDLVVMASIPDLIVSKTGEVGTSLDLCFGLYSCLILDLPISGFLSFGSLVTFPVKRAAW